MSFFLVLDPKNVFKVDKQMGVVITVGVLNRMLYIRDVNEIYVTNVGGRRR